ncbi:MAG: double-strand break repair protein AddB, partial [Pseudomonadota bacterium]
MSALAPPAARPAVFAIPPGEDYAARFAEGLAARLPDDRPEAAAEAVVYVNTRRALRTLEDALARRHGAKAAAILPRLAVLDEIGTDPLAAAEAEALPPAGNPLRRRLAITRLVEGWLARDGLAAPAAAPELADSLAGLIDLLDEEGVADSALDALVPDAMAEHWQKARDLLALVRARWPAIRAESEADALDPAARARAAIARQCTAWAAAPPQTPVIVAASTGSRAGAAALMAAVARLPRGALVLPGFDAEAAADIWPSVSAEHPYGPFRRLFEALGIGPADVRPWLGDAAPSPRRRLLAEALRPAPVTDAWIAGRAGIAALAAEATAGLSLIEAPHPRAEAAAIALAMREALERPGRRVALVTRDATLARRVSAELARFGVLADDSLGRPLSVSPAGSLLRLTLAAARAAGAEPVPLAALLAHPLCRAGRSRGAHLALARAAVGDFEAAHTILSGETGVQISNTERVV